MSHRYQLLETLGDGTFGTVVKARHRTTGSVVAIKQLKQRYQSWPDAVNLREVTSLRKLSNHPHIVQVREVIRDSDGSIYFVFEYMADGNLYELIRRCTRQQDQDQDQQHQQHQQQQQDQHHTRHHHSSLTDHRIRSIVRQILDGLSFMHSQGYFHRDLKPENILVSGNTIKVADFGLAREIQSRPPYTDYVSTRWYRAPEILLRASRYSKAIDSFAVGCIIAELYNLCPIFPGMNEVDQLFKVCSVIGTPTEDSWADGLRLAKRLRIRFPTMIPYHLRHQYRDLYKELQQQQPPPPPDLLLLQVPLEKLMKGAPAAAQDLTAELLTLDPANRLCAGDALEHEFFSVLAGNRKRGVVDAGNDATGNASSYHHHQKKKQQRRTTTANKTKRSTCRPLDERQAHEDSVRGNVDGYYDLKLQQKPRPQQQPNQVQMAAYPKSHANVFEGQTGKGRMGPPSCNEDPHALKGLKDRSNHHNALMGQSKLQQQATATSDKEAGGFHKWLLAGKAAGEGRTSSTTY